MLSLNAAAVKSWILIFSSLEIRPLCLSFISHTSTLYKSHRGSSEVNLITLVFCYDSAERFLKTWSKCRCCMSSASFTFVSWHLGVLSALNERLSTRPAGQVMVCLFSGDFFLLFLLNQWLRRMKYKMHNYSTQLLLRTLKTYWLRRV